MLLQGLVISIFPASPVYIYKNQIATAKIELIGKHLRFQFPKIMKMVKAAYMYSHMNSMLQYSTVSW